MILRGDKLSVRELAQIVCQQGDLYPIRPGPRVDAEDGVRIQQIVQAKRVGTDPAWRAEVALSLAVQLQEENYTLGGRADLVFTGSETGVVEELKCVGRLPDAADPVDMAQAMIYGGLLAHQQRVQGEVAPDIRVQLTYVELHSQAERSFQQRYSSGQWQLWLALVLLCLQARWRQHRQRAQRRLAWAAQLNFPFTQYRPGQRALARRVFRALRDTEHLLLEAPTGSGKSVGVLYPAVKALPQDGQLFFLTSRNAGAAAALAALAVVDPQPNQLAAVEIQAKEKVCPVAGMPCRADQCDYAAGYYDRQRPAVQAVLAAGHASREVVARISEAYTVCPFELSLDAALWADVVVGDYNYIFDPTVRLQRFVKHPGMHLLVDEAHQLAPRAQDMLSVELSRQILAAAKQSGHSVLARRAAAIDRALLKIRREQGQGEHQLHDTRALQGTLQRFVEAAGTVELDLAVNPEFSDCLFACHRWLRSLQWGDADTFVVLADIAGRQVGLRRECLDPAQYLHDVATEYGSSVRFSATLSPMAVYQRQHGQVDAPAERAQNPFLPQQLAVLTVADLSTYFRQRQTSLPRLVQLLADIFTAHAGHYLVALPSFAYLYMVATASAGMFPQLVQQPGAKPADIDALLAEFADMSQGMLFMVMGGSLGESVDFTGIQLSGVINVGVGLPPPSLSRDLQMAYFDAQENSGWGQMIAYTQPALVKNLQAAGRLIRSPRDRGIICLVDPRFDQPGVRQFFPSHWQPQRVAARNVASVIQDFWQQHMQPKNMQTQSMQTQRERIEDFDS